MQNDFRVEVKNFGAVKDGVFDIKPLTIFIGDNDSGKSYISKFVYIICKHITSFDEFNSLENEIDFKKYKNTNFYRTIKEYTENLIIDKNAQIENKTQFNLENDFFQLYINDLEILLKKVIKRSIDIYFSNNLSDLININSNEAYLNISLNNFNISIEIGRNDAFDVKMTYENKVNFGIDLKTKYINKNENIISATSYANNNLHSFVSVISPMANDIEYLFKKLINMFFSFSPQVLGLSSNIDYFPANKSGILSNYNTKFQKNIATADEYIFKMKNLEKDNYIVNDFINIIKYLSLIKVNDNDEFLKSYSYILKQIDGKVYFDDNKSLQYKLSSSNNELEIPIENISTKVTELISIILYLEKLNKKAVYESGTSLIIEEPESHLNPKMQRVMARLLVMMMNEGIQILITTHSDYILNEMDILLKLNHIKEKDEKVFDKFIEEDKDYESLMSLDKDDLAVYRFKKEGLDTEIENIKITKNKVIEKEFEETSENLYLENSKVIDILKSI